MKKTILGTMVIATLISSCNTAYQSGQTPDDLYYSPGKEISSSEVKKRAEDGERYDQYVRTMDDRYLRMKVTNRNQWGSMDDFSYWNDMRYNFTPSYSYNAFNNYYGYGIHGNMYSVAYNPWSIGWNYGWNTGWNYYGNNGWGYGLGWSNPIYCLVAYSNPKSIPTTYTSGSNINAYRNRSYNNSNDGDKYNNWSSPSTSGNNKTFGSLIRSIISTPSNGSGGSENYDRPARTFSSSIPTNSSAGGSSGGVNSTGSSANSGRAGRGQ